MANKKRITLMTLLKIAACCVIGWICLIVCIETENIYIFLGLIPTVIIIVLTCLLFNKLNKIIEILQKILDEQEIDVDKNQ